MINTLQRRLQSLHTIPRSIDTILSCVFGRIVLLSSSLISYDFVSFRYRTLIKLNVDPIK